MTRFLFYLLLVLILLFLIFFGKDTWSMVKNHKNYKSAKKTTCQVKSQYGQTKNWVKKQGSSFNTTSEKACQVNKEL